MNRIVLPLLLAMAAPLGAQQSRPATWKVVPDRAASDSSLHYATMPPGWHVTTGPGALFFDPAWQVGDSAAVSAVVFLFPDSGPGEYGVFVAGSGMDGPGRRYTEVVLRRDGMVGIFRQGPAGKEILLPWTVVESVAKLDGKSDGPVRNVLLIESRTGSTTVSVNGSPVATMPESVFGGRAGQAGLRVGEKMNLHVSKFEISGQ